MSPKEVKNPKEPVPEEGQTGEGAGGEDDFSELSLEELKKLAIKAGKISEPEEKPEEEVIEEKPTEEPPAEIGEEIPEDLLKKSSKELATELHNLRKLEGKHQEEISRLRKLEKEIIERDEKLKEYQINSTKTHILRQVKEMTPEERDKFYEQFSVSPDKALKPYIEKIISPFTIVLAEYRNKMAEDKLIADTKDSIVPYNKEEVNKILSVNLDLFNRYGSGAFREAYNIYRDKNIDRVLRERQEEMTEKAKKEADTELAKKKRAFTEPQGISSAPKSGKPVDYENMTREQLGKLIGKPDDIE